LHVIAALRLQSCEHNRAKRSASDEEEEGMRVLTTGPISLIQETSVRITPVPPKDKGISEFGL